MRSLRHFLFASSILAAWLGLLHAAEPIRVLLLSGQNNHDWQETTPVLRAFLEQTGRFQVTVTEHPEALTPADFASCQVVLSNWNTFARRRQTPPVTAWPEPTRQAFLDFVRRGGGHVTVHAGSSSFYEWEDYHRIGLVHWDLERTIHGLQHQFPVHLTRSDHPILRGLSSFSLRDELWRDPGVHPAAEALAWSFSSKDDGGRETLQPCLWVGQFGQGRCFSTTLGHNALALSHPTLQLILARAVAWAARQEVTLGPADFPPRGLLHWSQSPEVLALARDGQTIWQFNALKSHAKPSFHPLTAPGGETLSAFRPLDHPWHRGAWWSWKFLNRQNFWEEDAAGVPLDGLTEVASVQFQPHDDFSATIRLELRYSLKSGLLLLREVRTLEVSPPASDGSYAITSRHSFTAVEPVAVDAWYYGGFSLRLAGETLPSWQFLDPAGFFSPSRQSNLSREHGQPRLASPPVPWVAFVENPSGPGQGVALFDHPANPRHPSPWLVLRDMPFFGPVFTASEPLSLAPGETLDLRYQLLCFRAPAGPTPFLQEAYRRFATSP